MKAFATTVGGIESSLSLDIEEIIGSETELHENIVSFEADREDLFRLAYLSQAAERVLSFVAKIKFDSYESFVDNFEEALKNFEAPKGSFRVRCSRQGEHAFNSRDVEEELGSLLWERTENPEVDLENPVISYYCQILEDEAWLGIDYAGRNLGNRDYKLYGHTSSVRGNLAYHIVRISGFDGKGVLLDPFTDAGMVPIEASKLSSGESIHDVRDFAFEKFEDRDWNDWYEEQKRTPKESRVYGFNENLKNMKRAAANAKVAMSDADFSKKGISWLDTEFGEGEVDFIVSYPPQLSKFADRKKVLQSYDELFYQAEYVLSGPVVLLMQDTEKVTEIAEKHGFSVDIVGKVTTGDIDYSIVKAKK